MSISKIKAVFTPDPRLQKYRIWFAVGCAILAAIFYVSFTTQNIVSMKGNLDKLYHAMAYWTLMFWWLQIFPQKSARILLGVLFILMSGGIEMLQSFHPMRHMDWWDFVVNGMGVAIAVVMGQTKLDQMLYRFEEKFFKRY